MKILRIHIALVLSCYGSIVSPSNMYSGLHGQSLKLRPFFMWRAAKAPASRLIGALAARSTVHALAKMTVR